jgi:hypothetical protein
MSAVLGDDAQDVCSLLLVGGSDHSESKSAGMHGSLVS